LFLGANDEKEEYSRILLGINEKRGHKPPIPLSLSEDKD
tara:strand:- start:1005 stop:1121 length:117 start_codon:yes stop_codon:yes gene_type:complete